LDVPKRPPGLISPGHASSYKTKKRGLSQVEACTFEIFLSWFCFFMAVNAAGVSAGSTAWENACATDGTSSPNLRGMSVVAGFQSHWPMEQAGAQEKKENGRVWSPARTSPNNRS